MDQFLVQKNGIWKDHDMMYIWSPDFTKAQLRCIQQLIQRQGGSSTPIDILPSKDQTTSTNLLLVNASYLEYTPLIKMEWIHACAKKQKLLNVKEYIMMKTSNNKRKEMSKEEIIENIDIITHITTDDITHDDEYITEWKQEGSLYIVHGYDVAYKDDTSLSPSDHILGFDLDGTIIQNTFNRPKTQAEYHQWTFLYPSVSKRLHQEHQHGAKIVLLSNQLPVSRGKITIQALKSKINAILKALHLHDIIMLIATADDGMRKPRTGAWDYMIQEFNNGHIPTKRCMYVGDAAGRPKEGGRKRADFAASDWKFAMNLKVDFKTPEGYFLNSKAPLNTQFPLNRLELDPRTFTVESTPFSLPASIMSSTSSSPIMLILVGPPASGKTTFCKTRLKSKFTWINGDTLGSVTQCSKRAHEALQRGENVVIDNTNRTRQHRRVWIDLAIEMNITCTCLWFTRSKALVFHLEKLRQILVLEKDSSVLSTRSALANVVVHSYFKQLQEPSLSEGFHDLIHVPFIPCSEGLSPRAIQLLSSFLI